MISFPPLSARVQSLTEINQVELFLLREDEIHPKISGNKFRKLKYNLEAFQKGNYDAILSFGGAYSNHIAALAAAGTEFNLPTIGIIRGEELLYNYHENPTLKEAEENGMKLHFISRTDYRMKENPEFLNELQAQFGSVYLLPEGGTNQLAIQGCEEILGKHTEEFDYITAAVGTGGTLSGLINSKLAHQKIIGFPALKDAQYLKESIQIWTEKSDWDWINDYHFGGYGKVSNEFIDFLNEFTQEYSVNLDPIYTGKMVFGLIQMMKNGFFPIQSKVLAIHTGGLQGIKGLNQRLIKENRPIII